MSELLQEELDKAKSFFETQGKSDNSWYKLYSIKSVDSSYGRDDLRAKNFNSNSLNESLEMLERDMKRYGDTSKEFWCLKHYTTSTDPQPISLILKNPFFNPANHKGYMQSQNGVNGLGQNNNIMMDFMREHYTRVGELDKRIIQIQHDAEIEKKDRIIEDLQHSKRSKFDAINDFIETPVGMKLAEMFMMKILGGSQPQPQIKQQQQQPQEVEEQPTMRHDSSNQEQQNHFVQVQNAMENLQRVFGSDSINALEAISIYCTENPDIAYQMFQKRQANGKGQ